MKLKRVYLVLLLSFDAYSSTSTLNLKQALTEGLGKNLTLKSLKSQVTESEWKRTEAFSTYLPKLEIRGRHLLGEQFQVLPVSLAGLPPADFPAVEPYTIWTGAVSYSLFDGFSGYNHYRATDFAVDAANLQYQHEEFEKTQEIRSKFLTALAAEAFVKVAKNRVGTLEEHLTDVQKRVTSGVGTRFDYLRTQVQLSDARPDLQEAIDRIALARQELANVMCLERDSRPLHGSLVAPPQINVDVLDLHLEARNDYRALVAEEKAVEAESSASKGFWLPQISLFYNRDMYDNTDHAVDTTYKNAFEVGLLMRWELFDGGVAYSRQKEMSEKSFQSHLRVEQAKLAQPQEFDTWKLKYKNNLVQFHSRELAVRYAEESVRLARVGIRSGTRTNSDLLDAEGDLYKAQAGMIQKQLETFQAILRLETLVGHELANWNLL